MPDPREQIQELGSVWVVLTVTTYEIDDVDAVFASREAAERYVSAQTDIWKREIREFELRSA